MAWSHPLHGSPQFPVPFPVPRGQISPMEVTSDMWSGYPRTNELKIPDGMSSQVPAAANKLLQPCPSPGSPSLRYPYASPSLISLDHANNTPVRGFEPQNITGCCPVESGYYVHGAQSSSSPHELVVGRESLDFMHYSGEPYKIKSFCDVHAFITSEALNDVTLEWAWDGEQNVKSYGHVGDKTERRRSRPSDTETSLYPTTQHGDPETTAYPLDGVNSQVSDNLQAHTPLTLCPPATQCDITLYEGTHSYSDHVHHDAVSHYQHSSYSELTANVAFLSDATYPPHCRRDRDHLTDHPDIDRAVYGGTSLLSSPGTRHKSGQWSTTPFASGATQTSSPLSQGPAWNERTRPLPVAMFPSAPRESSLFNGTSKSSPEGKRLSLACHFCRDRKIACGRPPEGCPDPTCNQCARRSLKCEYPTESRRGQHKRPRKATEATTTDDS